MQTKATKTLADFRSTHDPNVVIPTKIRTALKLMESQGAENWCYELEFLQRASISATQIAQFRDQFAEHIVEVPSVSGKAGKRVWFGSAKVAAKVRGEA
jgi:hypothetical protein